MSEESQDLWQRACESLRAAEAVLPVSADAAARHILSAVSAEHSAEFAWPGEGE